MEVWSGHTHLLWKKLFHLKAVLEYVTVRAKISLVHTYKFATSVLNNFGWERSTELKFVMLVH